MEEAIAAMKRLGATIVDPANIETSGKFDDSEVDVLHHEFKIGPERVPRRDARCGALPDAGGADQVQR